jgi:uncharacterized membrane protein required for colicin V production
VSVLIDFLLVISIVIIFYFGLKAGFTRSFFAALCGFVAIFAASTYPSQDALNQYLVFAIAAVVVFLIGAFVFRAIEFFYMTIIDKAGGAILGVFIWTIVSVNLIIPSLDYKFKIQQDANSRTPLYAIIDEQLRMHIPIFRHNASLLFGKSLSQKFEDFKATTKSIKETVTDLDEKQKNLRS